MNDNNKCVMLDLDKPRELRCSNRVLMRFSAMRNCSVPDIMELVTHFDHCWTMAVLMLTTGDNALGVEQAEDLLDAAAPVKLVEAVVEAVANALNRGVDAGGEEVADDPLAGTGTTA